MCAKLFLFLEQGMYIFTYVRSVEDSKTLLGAVLVRENIKRRFIQTYLFTGARMWISDHYYLVVAKVIGFNKLVGRTEEISQ